MAVTVRPRRSVLYMPGSNARALEKAKSLPADGLILDFEDAVSPDAKPEARRTVAAALAGGRPYGRREVIVRINALNTPWGMDDLRAVAPLGIDGLAIPKVESADAVRQVQAAVRAAGGPENLPIFCMLETPIGILRALEIATASPHVAALVMGTSDLAKDLHCEHTRDREPFLASLGLVVLAARAAGVAALDGVHLDLADDDGFAAACLQGRQMGFDGKTLIHPKTLEVANRVFAPAPGEVAKARELIAAYAEGVAQGKGVVVLDGKLIEQLHVDNARRMVALAEAISAMECAPGE
ncbi:(3S)-malyl-CoA thioesterase [uncultured Alphaproteobacteria bacterium]|uniref:(3S)-malyl-CoA thioesterase n=1 Tax=uncultured Alphaproteobacteria bacterium TaxID=91750 RepID=A0A212K109_9PROT|nr:(3S)-malyl-CoA thioesterase [uncultured Alphaproteobacteria bacterium]